MSMEADLRVLLRASPAVAALVGDRVNWGEHPQDAARPYVVLQLISMTRGHTQQGPDGIETGRVQIDCYDPSHRGAQDIGRAVLGVLDFHRGGRFRGVFFAGQRMGRENLGPGDAAGEALYRASLDFLTHWRDDNAH